MDAFKLVMDQRHLDKRAWRAGFIIVEEAFQPRHQGQNLSPVLRRDMDQIAGAGRTAEPILPLLQRRSHEFRKLHASCLFGSAKSRLANHPQSGACICLGQFCIQ